MEDMPDGDIMFYADGGCTLRDAPAMWKYFRTLMRNVDIVAFQLLQLEAHWTKGDIFKRFGLSIDSQYARTWQNLATYFIIKNNEKTRKFKNIWLELVDDLQLL